ncbi:MAG: transglycosylase domain-containing protein [Candidatus Symbiodolus clandestinus]
MRSLKIVGLTTGLCLLAGILLLGGLYGWIIRDLPDVAKIKEMRLQVPLQIYTLDGQPIAQFGEKQRIPLTLAQIPERLQQAFIAIEDNRFYSHYGIDPLGILRALWVDLSAKSAKQGASTITQQLARNFFLDSERCLMRKFKEVILALQLERLLTKEQIFELYLNKIYLGNRAYGVGAAAQIYCGKRVDQLDLAEMALIAGLPKAPSTLNPLRSLPRATQRRNLVLARMLERGYITSQEQQLSSQQLIIAHYHGISNPVDAPHLAEMVRQEMLSRFGDSAYTDGYRVYTTLDSTRQQQAQRAVQHNLFNYDRRHGYRGPSAILWEPEMPCWSPEALQGQLKKQPTYGPLQAAVIVVVHSDRAEAYLSDGKIVELSWAGLRWARPFINDQQQSDPPQQASDVVAVGHQVWLLQQDNQWWLAQIPEVESAFIALHPTNGAIQALIGGFNFSKSAFNRAIQSARQIGSMVKPFVYAAALEKGMSLATLLNDLPIIRWSANAGKEWRPKNVVPRYDGPLRLRVGLARSKNVMAVRALRAIGVQFAADYIERFGFPKNNITRMESLALGAMVATPLQVARAYTVFANGGYLVDPYFIERIEDAQGTVIYQAAPKIASPTDQPLVYEKSEKADVLRHSDLEQPSALTEEPESSVEADEILSSVPPPPTLEWLPFEPLEGSAQPIATTDPLSYAPHVISDAIAFLIKDSLISAIWGEAGGQWAGTGWRARSVIKRRDIAGKTGTTNDAKDAWFTGFGPDLVTCVWIGFDDHRRDLGKIQPETAAAAPNRSFPEGGSRSVQPAWNQFMQQALAGIPEQPKQVPEGIHSAFIDMRSGKRVENAGPGIRLEYFIPGTEPPWQTQPEHGSLVQEGEHMEELF